MDNIEAQRILDANRVTILEDPASPVEIVERLVGLGKIELPVPLGDVASRSAMIHDTTEGLNQGEIDDLAAQGAVRFGWGGIAIPVNRTESQL